MKRNFLRSIWVLATSCFLGGSIWVLAISCFLGVSSVYAAGYGINSQNYYQPSASMSDYHGSGSYSTINGPNTPDYPTPSNNSGMNGPSVPECDAEHLDGCMSSFTCEDAQGYWNATKQKCEERLPETPEAINFDSNSSQASIDWGVSNGNVNLKSNRMHLNLHFPRYNKAADIYAAIYLEKEKGLYFICSNPSPKHIFSKYVVPMYKGIQQSVNATLIPDFDACKVLGKEYKGKMDVYWLVLPSQKKGANSWNGLETAVNNNPYLLQWYSITIDCTK